MRVCTCTCTGILPALYSCLKIILQNDLPASPKIFHSIEAVELIQADND